jgi:hypothetical protein
MKTHGLKTHGLWRGILAVGTVVVLLAQAPAAQAAIKTVSPINFDSSSDYDNTNPTQTTGLFRDLSNNGAINQSSTDVNGGSYTVLNFVATADTVAGKKAATAYDETPTNGTVQNTFYGPVSMESDLLYKHGTNSTKMGMISLLSESGNGIGFLPYNGGSRGLGIYKLGSTGDIVGAALASTAYTWSYTTWYHMTMDVTFPSSTQVTVTGNLYALSPATPAGTPGGSPVATVTYTGTLSTLGLNQYGEVGLTWIADATSNKTSFTDFGISGNDGTPVAVAGGPYTVLFNGNINLAGSTGTGSYGTVTTWAWDLDNNGSYETSGQTTNITYNYLVNTLGLSPDGVARAIGLKVTNDVSLTSTAAGTLSITPEPATMALMGLGGLCMGLARMRGRKRAA